MVNVNNYFLTQKTFQDGRHYTYFEQNVFFTETKYIRGFGISSSVSQYAVLASSLKQNGYRWVQSYVIHNKY